MGVGRYLQIRSFTEELCAHLDPEDLVAQSMPDASPAKWHLAHTTWFFETFLLKSFVPDYEPLHPAYAYLFNSYYNAVGERHQRPLRGVLTRPRIGEIKAYRTAVNERMAALLDDAEHPEHSEIVRIAEIGLHHEQQHQELILSDLKHLFSLNVLAPAYRSPLVGESAPAPPLEWCRLPEGIYEIGHRGSGFAFDNEGPAHRVFLEPFALSNRLVTNAEYREFIQDGGYERAELWLDRGWSQVQKEGWRHPLYWRQASDGLTEFTLAGERELQDTEPVSHVSYLEADAFARWAGARLPTEFEWEVAAASAPLDGNFAERRRFHPAPAPTPAEAEAMQQLFGDVWEWTGSSYSPYPGYRTEAGALGEYNGKFMCDQIVLRGGSCATSHSHIRGTYRNFFYPADRWQFSGIRLGKGI